MNQFKFDQTERDRIETELMLSVHKEPHITRFGPLIDRIEQIISARGESDGWVRVEDGLPKENETCFFYARGCRPLIGTYKPDGKAFLCSEDNDFWIIKEMEITHWQPLPSPPKTESK